MKLGLQQKSIPYLLRMLRNLEQNGRKGWGNQLIREKKKSQILHDYFPPTQPIEL